MTSIKKEADQGTEDAEISDDLFSDEDTCKDVPDILADDSLLNDTISITPLNSTLPNESCVEPVVPVTPLSLAPFIMKNNMQWSKDLETPEGNSTETENKDAVRSKEDTPSTKNVTLDKLKPSSVSPILNAKRIKRRPKRRIFKSLNSEETLKKEKTILEVPETTVGGDQVENEKSFASPEFFNNANFSDVDKLENGDDAVPKHEDALVMQFRDIRNKMKQKNKIVQKVEPVDDIMDKLFEDVKILESSDKTIKADNKDSAKVLEKKEFQDLHFVPFSQYCSMQRVEGKDKFDVKEEEDASKVASNRNVHEEVESDIFFEDELPCELNFSVWECAENQKIAGKSYVEGTWNGEEKKLSEEFKYSDNYGKEESIEIKEIRKCEVPAFAGKNIETNSGALLQTKGSVSESVKDTDVEKKVLEFQKNVNEIEERNSEKNQNSPGEEMEFRGFSSKTIARNWNLKKMYNNFLVHENLSECVSKDEMSEGGDLESFGLVETSRNIESLRALVNKNESFKKNALLPLKKSLESPGEMEEESETKGQIPESVGSFTAAGRKVQVSEATLLKSKRNLESVAEEKAVVENVRESFGFSNAVGKKLKISETAWLKSKKVFDSLEDPETKGQIPESVGFSTAAGKKVQVSEATLAKSKQIFESVSEEKTMVENVPQSFGFSNAAGKKLKISETAWLKSKKVFDSLEESEAKGQIPESVGSSTAAGREVQVSETTLLKSKGNLESVAEEKAVVENVRQSFGFSNAAGKKLKISETAWLKSKKVFDSLEEPETKGQIPESVGFSTAAGKKVQVSEATLAKSKQILETVGEEKTMVENVPQSFGFSNAMGKKLHVPESALSKSKKMMESVDENLGSDVTSNNLLKSIENSTTTLSKLKEDESSGLLRRRSLHYPTNLLHTPEEISKGLGLKRKAAFSEEFKPSKIDNSSKIRHSNVSDSAFKPLFPKRKIEELDDNTPSGRKRLKQGTELYGRKLFCNTIEDIKRQESTEEIGTENMETATNDLRVQNAKENLEEDVVVEETKGSPVLGSCNRNRLLRKKRKRRKINLEESENSEIPQNKNEDGFTKENDKISSESHSESNASSHFGDTQLLMQFINETEDLLQKRVAAAAEQEKVIHVKRRSRDKQITGSLLKLRNSLKKEERIRLKDIGIPHPCFVEEITEKGLKPEMLRITASTAASYRFNCAELYEKNAKLNAEGLDLIDGGKLIMDEHSYVGLPEFEKAFLSSPGVDPNLIPFGWIENHYKWIIWKLASMDRMNFSKVSIAKMLTPENTMQQLKYRYDREIDRSERPVIRKIFEKDIVASQRMVLCVSRIHKVKQENQEEGGNNVGSGSGWKYVVELTDGWYSIPANLDMPLSNYVSNGKIVEGMKLVIYGAELLNCEEGCPPLEASKTVSLKIHTNSTRRARWHAKLGYQFRRGPFPIRLSHVNPYGGLIGQIIVAISRIYPTLYREKGANGESIFRNEKCEQKAQIAFEKEREYKIEAIYAKVHNPLKRRSDVDSETDSLDILAMEWKSECEKLSNEESLTSSDKEKLLFNCRTKEEELKRKLELEVKQNLPPSRVVSRVLRLRVVSSDSTAILTIWGADEETDELLKEGVIMEMHNLQASGKRAGELQLSTTRNTVFKPRKNLSLSDETERFMRHYSCIRDIQGTFTPHFNEFDTVGLVTLIGDAPHGMKDFDAVYLSYLDGNASQDAFHLCILFWQGISNLGFAEMFTLGSFVACYNLEWHRNNSWSIPIAYCTERTTFARNPRHHHLQKHFQELQKRISDPRSCAEKLGLKIPEQMTQRKFRSGSQNTPNRGKIAGPVSEEKMMITPVHRLKMSSIQSPSDMTPSSLEIKSSRNQQKLAKLECYGEPPKLSPIVLRSSSSRVSMDFKPPVLFPET